MKIPKYIDEAISARERAAGLLIKYDRIITEYMDKHGIECEYTNLHCGVIAESSTASACTRKAIESHKSL